MIEVNINFPIRGEKHTVSIMTKADPKIVGNLFQDWIENEEENYSSESFAKYVQEKTGKKTISKNHYLTQNMI